MTYRHLPTVATGDLLSAAWLNQLSDNVEYIYGIVSNVNVPFYVMPNLDGDTLTYYIRHREQYLHFRFRKSSGTISSVVLEFDGNDVSGPASYMTVDNALGGDAASYTGVVDLDDAFDGTPYAALTSLNWYKIEVTVNWSASGDFDVDLLFESNVNTKTVA